MRLLSKSANPMFTDVSGQFVPVSQSSFLSFDVRFALEETLSTISLCSGLVQRVMENRLYPRGDLGLDPEMRYVQPLKVAHALHLEILSLMSPYEFVGSMSGGVEDLWDGVLQRALRVDSMVSILEQQLSVATGVLEVGSGVARVRKALGRRLEGLGSVSVGLEFPSLTSG